VSRKSSNCSNRITRPRQKSKMKLLKKTLIPKMTKKINQRMVKTIQNRKKNLMTHPKMKLKKLLKN